MSLVCYIPQFLVVGWHTVDGLQYPVYNRRYIGSVNVSIKARSKAGFNRVWNIFDSEDTIRK